jgi:membrane fusion protein, copper/silver efflux system
MTAEVHPNTGADGSKTPRRFTLRTVIIIALLSVLSAGGATYVATQRMRPAAHAVSNAAVKERYQCPMHPSIVQDHPGNCPICGMKLVKMGKDSHLTEPGPNPERKILFYRSPMDPTQTSHTPRKDEMGMDYIPVYSDEISDKAAAVSGLAAIDIDPERQQLIGLKTAEVVRGQVGGVLRTTGSVAVDETRVRHVNVKIAGFVERIYVDFIGKRVAKGDPLFTLYSPELLSAQEEFLLAIRTRDALSKSSGSRREDGQALVDAARRRLTLWDVSDAEIRHIEESGQPSKTLTIYSPASGVVTKKDVVEGMKLDAGAMPYEIVDLSSLWVLADVYESEIRFIKRGIPATFTLEAFPGRAFEGKVVFIDPFLNPQTRTIKVRLTFANPAGELRPDMFGEVVLKTASREGLLVPNDAVVDSGTAKVVFVAIGNGKFQPRTVELGRSDGSLTEVVNGLVLGEKVVTRANFLVDSESRLRASLNAMPTNRVENQEPKSAAVLPTSLSRGVEPKGDTPTKKAGR